MTKKHLALIFAFGPEARLFIYSGLMEALARDYRLSVLTVNPESSVFREVPPGTKVIPLPLVNEPTWLVRWRFLGRKVHKLWLAKQGQLAWRHYLQNFQIRGSDKLYELIAMLINGAKMEHYFFEQERRLARRWGTRSPMARCYQELGLEAVVASSYGPRVLPALQTAVNLGLKTIVMPNSWKDVFSTPRLPLQPSKLLVWNENNAEMFAKFNPGLAPETIDVVGSLHLSPFLTRATIMPREKFFHQSGLDPDRPFICYTAAAPQAVCKEEYILAKIVEAIRQTGVNPRPQLLLRLNPMEDGTRFDQLAGLYPDDLVVQKPAWEWFPGQDWTCAMPEDTALWVSTVFYAQFNISIASTVTLEFACLKKPVLNICFDYNGGLAPETSNRRFWDSDWYREIRRLDIAQPIYREADLITVISEILEKVARNGNNISETPEPWYFSNAVDKSKIFIDNLMYKTLIALAPKR